VFLHILILPEGWLYLVVVPDLISRKVVGWAMTEQMNTTLVENALHMAVQARQPIVHLLHHSDQGSQYTSVVYQDRLAEVKIQTSMSRVGNCYDIAWLKASSAHSKPNVSQVNLRRMPLRLRPCH